MRTRSLLPLALLALAATSSAVGYHFDTIDVPNADETFILDINDSGQWAGYTRTSDGMGGGFYTAITGQAGFAGVTTLARGGVLGLGASGINSHGTISGVSVAPVPGDPTGTAFHASGFLRDAAGNYETIDPTFSAYTEAVDVNDDGMVVGFYNTTPPADEQAASLNSHGYLRVNGVDSTLDYPGVDGHGVPYFGTQLCSVNNAGTVSGRYLDSDGLSHGFLYHSGSGIFENISLPDLSTPYGDIPFFSTESEGLNNDGDYAAIGYQPDADPSNPYHALAFSYIHTAGGYTPFAKPGALSTVVYGLNDHGQIVGVYADADYRFHGFTATPVPEPATFAALGLGALALVRRRRKA